VYSKVLQTVVERPFDNLKRPSKLKDKGYGIGQLKWKPPREFRSFTYDQSGFKLDKKGGQTVLSLSKLADIPGGFTALSPTTRHSSRFRSRRSQRASGLPVGTASNVSE